jgi:hypothetical protein
MDLQKLLISNDRNRVRGAVLGLSQDGACTNLLDNFRGNSLKRDLSNGITANPPLFSLVNTFNDFNKEVRFPMVRMGKDKKDSKYSLHKWLKKVSQVRYSENQAMPTLRN